MQRRLILLVASVVLAGVAVFLIKIYLERQAQVVEEQTKQELARRQESLSPVLLATRDIPKGATIEPDMLKTEVMLRDYIQPQAVSAPDRIIGMMTLVPISPGEQITLNKLISAKEATGANSTLAMATPIGKRAITISVDNIASLVGMIRPGDYVDVVAAVPIPIQTPQGQQSQQPAVVPLFQNVLVLAVGRELGSVSAAADARYRKAPEGGDISPLITLALSVQEASLITFVQEQGKVRLILRSPADSTVEPVQPASWDTLFQYLMAGSPQAKEASPEQEAKVSPPAKTREIEIYRGLNRETISLSK